MRLRRDVLTQGQLGLKGLFGMNQFIFSCFESAQNWQCWQGRLEICTEDSQQEKDGANRPRSATLIQPSFSNRKVCLHPVENVGDLVLKCFSRPHYGTHTSASVTSSNIET